MESLLGLSEGWVLKEIFKIHMYVYNVNTMKIVVV